MSSEKGHRLTVQGRSAEEGCDGKGHVRDLDVARRVHRGTECARREWDGGRWGPATQAGLGPFGLGDGDGPVQLHDGRASQAGELLIQCGDLRPVARDLGVQRGDGGLQNVGPPATQGERPVELGASSCDLLDVSAGPILIAEQHELAVAEPGLTTGVVQEHHRQQTTNLGVVGKHFDQCASQP